MIDLDALKAKLAEYDDARPRCPQKVARTVNCYDLTTYSPCCRPEGHEGECRNSRLILGWPGYVTVTALVAEVEHLRVQSATFRRLLAEVVIERDALQEQIDAATDAALEAELCEEDK